MIRKTVLDAINDAMSLVDQETPGICFVVCYVWTEHEDGFVASRFHVNRGPMCDEIEGRGYQVVLEFSRECWSIFWLYSQYGLRLEALREIVGYLPRPHSVSTTRGGWLTSSEHAYLRQSYSSKTTEIKPWMIDN